MQWFLYAFCLLFKEATVEVDLLTLVVQPTWKEFLYDLVSSEKMDPWDVDLIQVADAYLQKVRALQEIDLRIPANVILASALLLRFKADALSFDEEVDEEAFVEELQSEELPDLVFRPNRPRSRKLTLNELVQSLEQVMRQGRKPVPVKGQPIVMLIDVPKEDIHKNIIRVYEKTLKLQDAEGVLRFSELVENSKSADVIIGSLMPLLHLAQEQRVVVWQEECFGEIFIRVVPAEELTGMAAPPVEIQRN